MKTCKNIYNLVYGIIDFFLIHFFDNLNTSPALPKDLFKIIFFACVRYSRVPTKNVSPFGPAVWQAIVDIYIYTLIANDTV